MARLTRNLVQLSTFAGIAVLLVGCSREPKTTGASTDASTTSTSTTHGGATTEGTTTVTPTSTSEPTPTTSMPKEDVGGIGGQCNLFLQDCPEEQKCMAYNNDGGLFPDGARCAPVDPNAVGPGETCTLKGTKFGDGIDNCEKGSLCLDIENTGQATCVAYCTGSMDAPVCPQSDDRCSFLFEPTVPVCFSKCDPLLQDCAPGETCVPNEAALGAPHFVCMPRVYPLIPGKYGDVCYALSGCDPGNLCIFAENLPMCELTYCCSVWCDLTAVDPCGDFDPTLSCVPWFTEGTATPGYENVGVCGIMQ